MSSVSCRTHSVLNFKHNHFVIVCGMLSYNNIKLKRMKKYMYIIVLSLLLIACGNNKSLNKETIQNDIKEEELVVDKSYRLNDIWVADSIAGAIMPSNKEKHPRMEINIKEMGVSGYDGCNSYNGSLQKADNTKLEFTRIMKTMRFCGGASVDASFHRALNSCKTYTIENRHLNMYDESGNFLIRFLKID